MMFNPIPKVAAIHDLSGFGRSSLTIVIPILSNMGVQVCPIPTAVLSTHCEFEDYRIVDLTEHMKVTIEHWKKLNIRFDSIYSGFLGSKEQISIVKKFIVEFSKDIKFVVVDPVLGDDGKLYSPFSKDMVLEMRSLIKSADIITPNITEAALLLGKEYRSDFTEKEIKKWLLELSGYGPEIVIITSVPDSASRTKTTSVIAYSASDNRFWKVSCDYLPAKFPGTGDAFTSVIVGALLQGDSLPIALDRAVQFVSIGIRATFGYNYNTNEGFLLERVIGSLSSNVQRSSYELLD
ncbi:MAG: pyridoxamine kinase [bacterium]|nr:pyridoxamine kinase [bacterium]